MFRFSYHDAIIEMVRNNQLEVLKQRLAEKLMPINSMVDEKGNTLLHMAVSKNHKAIIEHLITQTDINIHLPNIDSKTALQSASNNELIAFIKSKIRERNRLATSLINNNNNNAGLDLAPIVIFALDADGSLYNKNYTYLFIHFMNQTGFLKEFWQTMEDYNIHNPNLVQWVQNKLTQEEQNFLKKTLENFRQGLENNRYTLVYPPFPAHIQIRGCKKIIYEFIRYLWFKDRPFLNQLFQIILLKANEELIETMQKLAEKAQHLVFVPATNRLSYQHDEAGMQQGTGSLYLDLRFIIKFFQDVTQKNCIINTYTVTDTIAGLSDTITRLYRGQNYRAILNAHISNANPPQFAPIPYDNTKFILLYGILQDAKINSERDLKLNLDNEKRNITIHFVDDMQEIIEALADVFLQYPQLIPEGISLYLIRHDGTIHETYHIVGTGRVDVNFEENLRWLWGVAPKDKNNGVDVAKDSNLIAAFVERVSQQQQQQQQQQQTKPNVNSMFSTLNLNNSTTSANESSLNQPTPAYQK